MKILIETEDTRPPTVSTLDSPAAAISEADGGAGLSVAKDSLAPDAESAAEDTGGPPQWLLNAVAKEVAGSSGYGSGSRDEGDGGAGPQ